MKAIVFFALLAVVISFAACQFRSAQNGFFNNQQQNRGQFFPNNGRQQRTQNRFNNRQSNNGRAINNNNNFRATPSNAVDAQGTEVYPGCNGTVCLPEASLCSIRKQKAGHFNFNGKSYWISWHSNENKLHNARWNWFTGRNYCRKMCMDMVAFESQPEQSFVADLMRASGVKDIHTAGRLCDAEVEGCDEQERFKPLRINGWFWASTLQMMPPTNSRSNGNPFNNWSTAGAKGQAQPDGDIKSDGFGVEACMALLDNKYGDGLKWHDEPCNSRRLLVCEDLPAPNINFVRNQNPNIKIP